MTKTKKPHTEKTLDDFVPHLRSSAEAMPVAGLVQVVFDYEPNLQQVESAVKLLEADHRFEVIGVGKAAAVKLSAAMREGEPEDITAEAAAVQQESAPVAEAGDPPPDITPPAAEQTPPFTQDEGQSIPDGGGQFVTTSAPGALRIDGTAAGSPEAVRTIGEHIAQAEQTQAEAPAEKAQTETLTVEQVQAQRAADEQREKDRVAAELKRIGEGIIALENAIANIGADLKAKKDRLKVLRSEMVQVATGDTQTRLEGTDDDEDGDEIDPEDTPVARAARGEVPPIVPPAPAQEQQPMATEAPEMTWYRKMGATAAQQGKTELDCPFSRESNAKGLTGWLDGFREAKREDHSEREALVQALFRPALVEASTQMTSDGLLPRGEECPRAVTVKWDERPHLVVGFLSAEENEAGIERWSLVPLLERDEWDSLYAETYGPAIAGVDKGDQEREVRVRGGVDAGRLVKCGRKKMVVAPLCRLMVATTKPEAAAAMVGA